MPFTFAHPAIILPLKQAKPHLFSLTALVAGSMAPDFEYFFKFHATSTVSETLAGIFTFNLPVVIGISLLFHLVVRNPLLLHLPKPYDKRFSGFLRFHFIQSLRQHPIRFLGSALIGIASHLILDLLTSPDTMTRSFHKLQQIQLNQGFVKVQAILGLPPFILLERTYSILGLILIGYLLSRVNYPAKNFLSPKPQQKRRFFTLFFFLFIAGVGAAIVLLPYALSISQLIINSISAGLLSLLVTSLLFWKDGSYAARG